MECKHGRLARSCNVCELEGEVARLREDRDDCLAIIKETVDWLVPSEQCAPDQDFEGEVERMKELIGFANRRADAAEAQNMRNAIAIKELTDTANKWFNQIEKLEEDKARLDWLIKESYSSLESPDENEVALVTGPGIGLEGDEIRAAIDAAEDGE